MLLTNPNLSLMPTSADVLLAERLRQARENLQTNIEQAVRAFEDENHEPIALRLDFTSQSPAAEAPDDQRPLAETIDALVRQFQQSPDVQQAGTRVVGVTPIDSDADGTAAVNVKYASRDES